MLPQIQSYDSNLLFSKHNSQNDLMKNQNTLINDEDNSSQRKSILKKKNTLSSLSIGTPSNLQSNTNKKKSGFIQTSPGKKKKIQTPAIKYDLNELQNKIDELNSKINEEKNISINNYNNLNNEINSKVLQIKNLASEQNELISKLKSIKDQLNNTLERANNIALKNSENVKNEKKLKKLITVKEKEIELANKRKETEKNEYKRIVNIYNKNNQNKENFLSQQLFELNNVKSKLELDIKQLKSKLDQHKYCDKHKTEMQNFLSLLTNAYQFELKMTNKIDMELTSKNKPEIKKQNSRSIEVNSNVLNTIVPKLKQNKKKALINYKSQPILSIKKTNKYITNALNTINYEYGKGSEYIKNSRNINYKMKKKNLFNLKENNFLEKVIPSNYLIKCRERFDNLENENNKLKTKINENKLKKDLFFNENQIKIEFKEMKLKVVKREELKLEVNLKKQKMKINELKKKINELNKETKKYNKLINNRNKGISGLKNKMNEFKKHKKKVKKKEDIGEQMNIDEENINNKEDKNYNLIVVHQKEEDFKEENQTHDINYPHK